MLVSEKQQKANRQNAQQSTGPKTPEGKQAVRFNALTWSLRARSLMISSDDPEEYQQLWNNLEAEWQPQTHTERYYLEQMATSNWLLTRNAGSESRIHDANLEFEKKLALLDAPAPAHKSARPQAPRPDYVMSEGQEAHPVFCSPITPDTR
jgi:hypothetical protein